jgi:hypothetical protein
MKILHRLKINSRTVTVVESDHSIDIEIAGAQSKKEERAIIEYLENEAILDEILAGNSNFAKPLPQIEQE